MIMLLGLSKRHSKTLDILAKDYLQKGWKDYPDVLYGIRKYASDAYTMFCVVDWEKVNPKDSALISYHNFLKKTYSKINVG